MGLFYEIKSLDLSVLRKGINENTVVVSRRIYYKEATAYVDLKTDENEWIFN